MVEYKFSVLISDVPFVGFDTDEDCVAVRVAGIVPALVLKAHTPGNHFGVPTAFQNRLVGFIEYYLRKRGDKLVPGSIHYVKLDYHGDNDEGRPAP